MTYRLFAPSSSRSSQKASTRLRTRARPPAPDLSRPNGAAEDRRPDAGRRFRLLAAIKALDLQRGTLDQLPRTAVRVAPGRDVAVGDLDQILKAPEHRSLAGVDVLQEDVATA